MDDRGLLLDNTRNHQDEILLPLSVSLCVNEQRTSYAAANWTSSKCRRAQLQRVSEEYLLGHQFETFQAHRTVVSSQSETPPVT